MEKFNEFLNNPLFTGVGGLALGYLVREAIAFGLRLKAAKMKADKDPANDAEADVLEKTADRLTGAPKP